MKQKNYIKGILAAILLLCSATSWAYSFSAKNDDGVTIYYNATVGTQVEVTYLYSSSTSNSEAYSGAVSIPETVTNNGTTYRVTSIGSYAFRGCTELTSVTIGNGVTSIGYQAFYKCSGLTSVTIGNSVTSIGDKAFQYCSGLTGTLTLPNSVTKIGQDAFSYCSGLTELTIGNGVKSIGSWAFQHCSGLTSVTVGESLTEIGYRVFYNCSRLASLTIPGSVESIGGGAFESCSGLTELTIGNGVTTISYDAFSGCTGLTEITIPNSVTSIGDEAFASCTGLTKVNFNAIACASAGSSSNTTFNGCSRLSTVTIGEDVTIIPDYLFYQCTSLKLVNYNATACTSVGSASNPTFNGCSSLSTVTIGEDVSIIPERLFYNCTGITEVNFNAIACASVGSSESKRAFGGCFNISTVNFGDNVTIIPPYLFCYQEELSGITLPNSVITIGDEAFYYCTGMTGTLTIPNSVTSIGNWAFGWCVDLTGTLTIPNSVKTIGDHAFYLCERLTEVTIGNSVTSIGDYAFTECSSFKKIDVEEDNQYYCSQDGVLYTKDMTELIQFPTSSSITSYNIPNSVTSIDQYAFYKSSGLTSLTIGNNVKTIGDRAFFGCSGLTGTLTIPNSVTEIGEFAFCDCSGLTEMTIGKSVITISYDAFYGCSGLTSIYSHNPEPPTCKNAAFYKVDKNTCTLYVPVDSKDKYSAADYWSAFTNIEEMTFNDLLIVQTYEASEVTTNSALLRGVVTVGDEEVLEQGFEYWTKGGDVQTITSLDLIMAVTLTGLEDGMTYTYRAYATTESGTTYGEEMTFTTIKAPTVQTYEVTEITENSALLKGYVTAGNEDVLGQGFEYWAAGGEIQTIAMADQMMAVTVTGLNEGTTYTCRAYAKTASGTTYGNEVTFTTLGTATITPPTVQTYEATEITESSATLSGVVAAGSEKVAEQGFEYWAEGGEIQSVTARNLSMTVTLTGLQSDTKYTYRAYAKTESGTTFGDDVSFTTLNIDAYKELEEAIEEMYEDFKAAWTTVITDYPDAEEDCMDYYDDIYDKVMDLTDMLDSNYRNGTLYDDVVEEIRSGIAEGERMIEEMLAAAKEVHETGIEDILANCGDDVQVYNLAGSRVHRLERGNVYIIRYSDGTVKKVLVK